MADDAGGARGYCPIEDYAAIGDCHGGALIARDGDIDWCCLKRFDADPILFRLLDEVRGGFLSTRPRGMIKAERAYVENTNILRTVLSGAEGRVALTDFMPVGRKPSNRTHDYVSLNAPHWLVRVIEVLDGRVDLECAIRPSAQNFGDFGDAASPTLIASDLAPQIGSGYHAITASLKAGERRYIVLGENAAGASAERIAQMLDITCAFWREWIGYCRYTGPHGAMIRRSALVLKLLSYAPSGATAAAMTTSLPECVGGIRNWDYRLCWVRDASLMLSALSCLGYSGEGRLFYEFLSKVAKDGPEQLQVGYGLEMERSVPERELTQLNGYRGSRPVRIGNGAFAQRQTDLYAYILEGALIFQELGGQVSLQDRKRFGKLVDFIGTCWEKPDQGIWETRGAPQHFVHSKAMCWAAVDRGLRLLECKPEWQQLAQRISDSLLRHGRGPDGAFKRAYDDPAQDGALLLLPMLGLPATHAAFDATLAASERELARGDLVLRYCGDDGIEGAEGAFLACSFWRVDALLAVQRDDEASALFERLLARANDVGLYAEEADPASGAFLGNFPQALTHLGLVASAVNLELYRQGGAAMLAGNAADRAKRAVGATLGWRGVVATLLRSPSTARWWSSRRSVMDEV